MKPIFNLALAALLFFSTPITAQITFAPPGSEWYHAMQYGTFHCYYTGDTVISGITARKVVQEAYTANPWLMLGLQVSNLPDLIVYNNADTVFAYNHLFGKFTPLYVFNVHQGDTVTLPVLPPEPAYMGTSVTDSFFRFVVDSIKMVTYDTAHLKTVYTTPIVPGYPHYYFVYGWDSAHSYAEKIGPAYGGIMPRCGGCAMLATDAIQFPASVRCYNDITMSVHIATGICGKDYTGTPELAGYNDLDIYPIPAAEILHINFAKVVNSTNVILYNVMGTAVYNQTYTQSDRADIDIRYLATGAYYLKISLDGIPSVTKLVSISR